MQAVVVAIEKFGLENGGVVLPVLFLGALETEICPESARLTGLTNDYAVIVVA
jgi:hypothetical protein